MSATNKTTKRKRGRPVNHEATIAICLRVSPRLHSVVESWRKRKGYATIQEAARAALADQCGAA